MRRGIVRDLRQHRDVILQRVVLDSGIVHQAQLHQNVRLVASLIDDQHRAVAIEVVRAGTVLV